MSYVDCSSIQRMPFIEGLACASSRPDRVNAQSNIPKDPLHHFLLFSTLSRTIHPRSQLGFNISCFSAAPDTSIPSGLRYCASVLHDSNPYIVAPRFVQPMVVSAGSGGGEVCCSRKGYGAAILRTKYLSLMMQNVVLWKNVEVKQKGQADVNIAKP